MKYYELKTGLTIQSATGWLVILEQLTDSKGDITHVLALALDTSTQWGEPRYQIMVNPSADVSNNGRAVRLTWDHGHYGTLNHMYDKWQELTLNNY